MNLEGRKSGALHIDLYVNYDTDQAGNKWKLVGIIYGGEDHFVLRYLTDDDRVWFHDGEQAYSVCDGPFAALQHRMAKAGRKYASFVFYRRL